MLNKKPIVLVIDDEESMRDSCCLILAKEGFQTETAENGLVGLEKVREVKPDIALIDLKMPGISGLEVLDKIKDIDPNIIPIVITGYATVESAVEAMKKGAYDFLPKPFTPEELRIIIRRGLERRRLIQEAVTLRREKKLMEENFITLVSHQLRSPLSAIVQYFEVILGGMLGKVEPRQKEMLTKARDRLEGLLKLINDWLGMAKMNGGQIVQKLKPISLKDILVDLVEFIQPSAQQEHIRVELFPLVGDDLILGDRETLEQVFSNLINNALKYNKPNGLVKVSIKENTDFIRVEIEDTGRGIPKEHLPFIFDQFYQVDRSEEKKKKGSGLGLAIAKKIVEAHGGRIEVTSEVEKGSVFSVSLHKAKKTNGNKTDS